MTRTAVFFATLLLVNLALAAHSLIRAARRRRRRGFQSEGFGGFDGFGGGRPTQG